MRRRAHIVRSAPRPTAAEVKAEIAAFYARISQPVDVSGEIEPMGALVAARGDAGRKVEIEDANARRRAGR